MGAPPIVSGCGGCQGRGRAGARARPRAAGRGRARRAARPRRRAASPRSRGCRPPERGRSRRWGRRACGRRPGAIGPWRYSIAGYASAPGTGRLAQLERGLVGQPDRPAAAEEDEAVEAPGVDRERAARARPRPPRPRASCRCPGAPASSTSAVVANRVWTTDRSSANGSSHGPPGGARQRALGHRGEGHGRDRARRGPPRHRAPRSSCPSARSPARASYAAAGRHLRGGERVGLAEAGGLARGRIRLGDEERRAAADHRHAGAVARQDVRGRRAARASRQRAGWLAISCSIALISATLCRKRSDINEVPASFGR